MAEQQKSTNPTVEQPTEQPTEPTNKKSASPTTDSSPQVPPSQMQDSALAKFRRYFLSDRSLLVEWEDLDENMDMITFRVCTTETIHIRSCTGTPKSTDDHKSPNAGASRVVQDDLVVDGEDAKCAETVVEAAEGDQLTVENPPEALDDVGRAAIASPNEKMKPAQNSEDEYDVIDQLSFVGPRGNLAAKEGKYASIQWRYTRQDFKIITVNIIAQLGIRVCAQRFLKDGNFKDLDLQYRVVEHGKVVFADRFRGTIGMTDFVKPVGRTSQHQRGQQTRINKRQSQQLKEQANLRAQFEQAIRAQHAGNLQIARAAHSAAVQQQQQRIHALKSIGARYQAAVHAQVPQPAFPLSLSWNNGRWGTGFHHPPQPFY